MKIPKPTSSSLTRAFDVLGMFSLTSPLIAVEDITVRLGYTRSTAYRYLKELCDAGLVAPVSSGNYSLGPRIVELERLVALTDPLYRAGQMVLPRHRRDSSALLLNALYGDRVLCTYKEGPDVLEHAGQRITIRRARGLPFPLFQGAGSLALLPYLSPHRIRQTYLHHSDRIAAAGLGTTWELFRRSMADVRRNGYATSQNTITPQVCGVAVPILLPADHRLVGSLARAFPSAAEPVERHAVIAAELRSISEQIALEYLKAAQR